MTEKFALLFLKKCFSKGRLYGMIKKVFDYKSERGITYE